MNENMKWKILGISVVWLSVALCAFGGLGMGTVIVAMCASFVSVFIMLMN